VSRTHSTRVKSRLGRLLPESSRERGVSSPDELQSGESGVPFATVGTHFRVLVVAGGMSSPSGPEESERRDDVDRADAVDRLDEVDASDVPDDATRDDREDERPDEQQWRFGADEVGEDAQTREPLEPESVSLENALFVALGVLLTAGIVLVAVL
jgi:hypothetical protein